MLHCCETRPPKARRVMCLYADEATQEKLRTWAQDAGFDLGWNYDGWPVAPEHFRFHVTLLATKNEVEVEDRWQPIGPLTVGPAGFAVMGADRRVPALLLASNPKLTAMRQFFIEAFGAESTFDEFQPHISLSYKWDGVPDLARIELPTFPLIFDALVVSILEGKTTSKDHGEATPMLFSDTMQVSGTRRTKDGYLVADVRAARTGIQEYGGAEVGRPEMRVVKVYRPPEEVFKRDSLASYAHKPVTVGHPPDGVTADNWKQIAVGDIGGEVDGRDGKFVRVPLVLMDAQAIAHVENGTRELSMGYECRLEFADGVTPEGEAYQAIQRDIRINHAAIVERGRAGPQCRIGDGRKPDAQRERPPATIKGNDTMNLRKVVVDGLTIETTDQGAEVIGKLQAALAASDKAVQDAKTALTKAADDVVALKKDHAKEIDDLKAKIPTTDQLEDLLKKRTELIDAAKKIVPDLDCAKLSGLDVRKTVVAKKLGDEAVKDKSAEHIAAQFDALCSLFKSGSVTDPVIGALKAGLTATNDAESERTKALTAQMDAWR